MSATTRAAREELYRSHLPLSRSGSSYDFGPGEVAVQFTSDGSGWRGTPISGLVLKCERLNAESDAFPIGVAIDGAGTIFWQTVEH